MARSFFLKPTKLFLGLILLASCKSMGSGGDALFLPKLRVGAEAPAGDTTLVGRLVRDGALLRLDRGGGGTVIVIWPRSATLQRPGGGTVVVVWPRTIGSGTPVRVGEPVELTGVIITTDDIVDRLADCPRHRGCTGPGIVVSAFRPAAAPDR